MFTRSKRKKTHVEYPWYYGIIAFLLNKSRKSFLLKVRECLPVGKEKKRMLYTPTTAK